MVDFYKIDNYRPGDEDYLTHIHKDSLSVGLLANLSLSTLRAYYLRLAEQDGIKILVVRRGREEVVGFCVVQFGNKWLLPFLSLRIVFGIFCSILRQPRFLKIIFSQIFSERNPRVDTAEIAIFCVRESYRGLGIGNGLVSSAVKWCTDNKIKVIYTTTHNERLVKFYLKNYSGEVVSIVNLGAYQSVRIRIS